MKIENVLKEMEKLGTIYKRNGDACVLVGQQEIRIVHVQNGQACWFVVRDINDKDEGASDYFAGSLFGFWKHAKAMALRYAKPGNN